MKAWLLALVAASCNHEPKLVEPLPATPSVQEQYLTAVDRLESRFLENGWVVSRKPGGEPQHTGDSLLWSGIALAVLPCDRGNAIEANLIETITRNGGQLVRYEPIGNPVSLDGAIGVWYGVAHRTKCQGKADLWRETIRLHLDYLRRSKNSLSDVSKVVVPPGIDYVPRLLGHSLGLNGSPDSASLQFLRASVVLWAKATVDTKSSAYRVHLGYLLLDTVETLGKSGKREMFCIASKNAEMPLIQNFCGDGLPLLTYIENFVYNQWEYFHQRSPALEATPDGGGDETPGLDLITAIKSAYQL